MSSEHPHATVSSAPTLEARWQELGWSAELLARAREAGVTEATLTQLLSWNPPLLARVEAEIEWAAKLREGRIRFRQLTLADGEAFRLLWANSPEAIGDWDVTVERGPNAFAQFQLQERPVLNALFDVDLMVACVSFSLRRTRVAGQDLVVRFGQAMRVHQDHRRHGYGNWVRSLPWAIGIERPNQFQYDYMRSRNMAMESWNRKHMPKVESVPVREDEVPGIPVTVHQFAARTAPGASADIRPARVEDLPSCVALINRTHAGRDLFRPYTPEYLEERLGLPYTSPYGPKPGYALPDFFVVEREGAVVACAGLWDRGRDLWERWRHRESVEERVIKATALLDAGHAEGHGHALASLITHFIDRTAALGRDHLLAPLGTLIEVAPLLAAQAATVETRYLQWRTDRPAITAPTHLDLVYW